MQTLHQSTARLGQSIYMIWTKINAVKENVLSLVSQVLPVVQSYLTSCYRTVRAFGVCLSQRFSKNIFLEIPSARYVVTTNLQLWNCFSYYPSVHRFDWMDGLDGKFRGKDKKFYPGTYLFTIDWGHPESNILNVEHSEIPQEHKCAHILALRNGNFAAQPNNRCLWHVNSYTTDKDWPDFKVQTTVWDCEDDAWVTEDSDNMFYDLEPNKSSHED